MQHDLNLVRVLVAMADCRQVSQAARQLRMTQPGVSNALRRLRATYDDPLFVRTSGGMEPTARAATLIAASRNILEVFTQQMLGATEFRASASDAELRFAMSDIGEMVFLPRILQHMQVHAPRATIRSVTLPHAQLAHALEDGRIDLAVGYFPDLKGTHFFQQKLFAHGFVCLLRADHPLAEQPLTLQRFLEVGHAVVQAEGRSQEVFEQHLRRRGIRRHIVLHVPHFMSIPHVIARSDLMVTVPLAVGTAFAARGDLKVVAPLFPLPRFDLKQHWHRRASKDPRNRWLRSQLAALFNETTDEWRDAGRLGKPTRAALCRRNW